MRDGLCWVIESHPDKIVNRGMSFFDPMAWSPVLCIFWDPPQNHRVSKSKLQRFLKTPHGIEVIREKCTPERIQNFDVLFVEGCPQMGTDSRKSVTLGSIFTNQKWPLFGDSLSTPKSVILMQKSTKYPN
jgi:hypothetical protein